MIKCWRTSHERLDISTYHQGSTSCKCFNSHASQDKDQWIQPL